MGSITTFFTKFWSKSGYSRLLWCVNRHLLRYQLILRKCRNISRKSRPSPTEKNLRDVLPFFVKSCCWGPPYSQFMGTTLFHLTFWGWEHPTHPLSRKAGTLKIRHTSQYRTTLPRLKGPHQSMQALKNTKMA